ncbi:MAG: hexose kinase [Actinomycetota bacterium]|nr:hexose kinase [Actinomycetota bacterium]
MIVTVTLNLAVDVTYRLDRIRLGKTSQVLSVTRRAGGKGVNVARTLHALGHEVVVTGLAGGATGAEARAELATVGLRDETVSIAQTTRTTLIAVEADGAATGLSEPGPRIAGAEWAELLARVQALLAGADALVLAGSLPPGLAVTAYAQLIALARADGVPVLLDTRGEALFHGASAGPAIVKVNAAELAEVAPGADLASAARELLGAGPQAVVVTMGQDGLLAVGADGYWRAPVPIRVTGNPTGAGDAASAALILGLLSASPWPERLADAAALAAAAVRAPQAGSFDAELYARLRPC